MSLAPLARRALRRVRYGRPIVVVSGLPRSGTSMMMQMLSAGGVEPLTDGVRVADDSNPRGYFELEHVKDLESTNDMSWLSGARGRAVKIIAFLIRHLPQTFNYKVIFMERRLSEILASQSTMLDHLGAANDAADVDLKRLFINHLARTKSYMAHRASFEVLRIRYHDVLHDSAGRAEEVSRFLGGGLDTRAMAGVVTPELYRNRS